MSHPAALLPLACLLLGAFGHQAGALPISDETTLEVLTYNVLVGFTDRDTGVERRQRVRAWLQDQAPDVVALQELNGFTSEELSTYAKSWGHAHSVLLKEHGSATGLTSNLPITGVRRQLDGFHHGLLVADTHGITFFVLHLKSGDYKKRLAETDLVLREVAREQELGRSMILLGDFNSESPADESYLATTNVAKAWRAWPPTRGNLRDGQLVYDVMKRYSDAGLVDLVAKFHRPGARQATLPTPVHRPDDPEFHVRRRVLRRLDYILASPALAARARSASAIQDDETHRQSDHYPVVATFARE